MAMSATNSYDYDYYTEAKFTEMWRGTDDRSKEFAERIEYLFLCPSCERTKTDYLYCSNSFHM